MTVILIHERDGFVTMGPNDGDYGPDDRQLLRQEVLALAMMYWPQTEATNAVNVAYEESNYHTGAWARSGEDSRGLWQININEAAHPELAAWNLFDPQINAYFAYQIYKAAGDWSPWYNSATKLRLPGGKL